MVDGLKLLLNGDEQFIITLEANSAEEMLDKLHTGQADILLTDITMPSGMNGYELALAVRKELPSVKILVLSMNEDGALITRLIEKAGVDGYISKAAGQQELLKAITTISSGGKYFTESIWKQYESYQELRSENAEMNLTSRELQIIECLMKHYSNKQIADELFISERTVETHRKNIYRKTNTKGEAALIQFVKEHRIV